ncbi:5-methyl-1-naphthoate synthase-like, partial [Frankliniella occidentalis]|uniref:5-methyl-1-naphthoate synthase-like n=1 Tax=Frankliniella occidentalis TaxID=133901 RepID=A0A9C6XWH4_FRAOC
MYRRSGIDPRRVAYVEGDGVGLPLQDTFELDALDAVLGKHRSRADPLLVGCVKSNTGHTEVASGMVGIAKCVVAMEHGVIPATINHATDLPCRALAEGRMKLVTANTPFKFDRQTYLAVSSHSMTGMFGHTILSPHAKPKRAVNAAADLPRLVLVSARSEAAARLVAEKIKSYSYDPEYLRLVQDVFGPTIRGYEYRSFVICPPEARDAVKVG